MTDIPILLVEDDEDLCRVLGELLELNGYQVTQAHSGLDFYRALDLGTPFQVALIDLGLPDQPGQVLAEYARCNTAMSVIIITANDQVENRVEVYRSGIDLFLSKPIDHRELLAAVSAMAARYQERQQPARVADETASGQRPDQTWRLDARHRRLLTPNGRVIALTSKESALCRPFCAHPEETIPREMLLEHLYGRHDHSAQRALDNLVRRLRGKISETTGESAPIITTYGVGYGFAERLVCR